MKIGNVRALGFDAIPEAVVTGVSTDSRTTRNGDAFFAIRGEKFDGHDFLTKAIGTGASVVVVDRKWADANGTMLVSLSVPRLVVENTSVALGDLARVFRMKFRIPVVAVAGSNGKTTTKNMISAVLGSSYNVLSTEGNLNNHIGVPQTLFRLGDEHEMAVVEIGTNHFGELSYLCRILAPTHGVITNIGREHLEFFRTVEGVAKAEGELIDWLRENKGTFFANKDDRHIAKRVRNSRMKKTVTFGFQSAAVDIKGNRIALDDRGCPGFTIRPKGKKPFDVQLNVPGEQNAGNALLAAAVGLSMGVAARNVAKALEKFSAAGKRMEVLTLNGLKVLNDTYNANPDSMIAALSTLRSMKAAGRRIAVLADMLELGRTAEMEHRNVGRILRKHKVDCLFTYGALAKFIHDAANVRSKTHCADKTDLEKQLSAYVKTGDLVLVKGSRGMKMEEVVSVLQQKFAQD